MMINDEEDTAAATFKQEVLLAEVAEIANLLSIVLVGIWRLPPPLKGLSQDFTILKIPQICIAFLRGSQSQLLEGRVVN